MRKLLALPLVIILLNSCKKEGGLSAIPEDNGCISRVYDKPKSITGPSYNEALQLMQKNNISLNHLAILNVSHDTVHRVDGAILHFTTVYTNQYFNNQPLLYGYLNYIFQDGDFHYLAGTRYDDIKLDTVPKLKLSQIRGFFLKAAEKDTFYLNRNSKDSCLKAQFGYLDVGAYYSSSAKPSFIKAWQVSFKNSDYPVAVFEDKTGKTITYDNGIRTLDKTPTPYEKHN